MSTYVLFNSDGSISLSCDRPFDGSTEVAYDVIRAWDGQLYKEGTEPPEPIPVVDYTVLAQEELDRSDLVALRCFKAGIAFPPEWVTYCESLREIVRTGVGPLPQRPEYPQGS